MSNNGGHLTVQYNLRWSEELRDKIAEEAKKNTRSMNQEIIARLEQSFEPKSVIQADNPEALQSIVAFGIKAVLDELRNEGVDDVKRSKALYGVAKK